MKKKLLVLLFIIALMVPMVSGCGGQATRADELVIAVPEEIQSTDMHQITWNNVVHDLLYEPLVTFDLDLEEIHPAACKSFEVSEDGKTITFIFDEETKFSNGDPLTAASVQESFERYMEVSAYGDDFDPITNMTVKDDQTLMIEFSDPPAFIWPVFATAYGGIVHTEAAEEVGSEEFGLEAVGNGPYYVDEWVQGSHITLLKNPYYQTFNPFIEGKANFEKITVRFIPEDFTRVSELEAGTVDIILSVPVENISDLDSNENIQLYDYLQTGINYLAVNTDDPVLGDLNVRKAMALGIDKEQLKGTLEDTVVTQYGLLSLAQLCYDEELENELEELYSYDPEQARLLLIEAGFTEKNSDGFLIKDGEVLGFTLMVTNDNPFLKKSGPVIQSQLADIGIQVELNEYDSRHIRTQVSEGDFEVAMRFYWWADPDILTYVYGTGNLPWSSQEVDSLFNIARYEMNRERRTELYSVAQKLVVEEMPIVPLFSERQYMAAQDNISGLKVAVDGKAYLGDVVKE